MTRLTLDIFNLYTKFGNSSFCRSGYMFVGIKTENGSYDPDYARFRGDLSFVG